VSTVLPGHFAEEWLSVDQCAEFFGCSPGAMKKRLKRGAIPHRVFWHKLYVRRADIADFLDGHDAPRLRRLRRMGRRPGSRVVGV